MDLFNYVFIFLLIIIFIIFLLYLFSTYLFPRKLDEIAKMITSGQTKLAIKKLSDILEKDSRNAYAHYLLAEAYLKESNFQYAILEFRQVLKLGRFDEKISEIEVRSKLSKIFLKKNAYEEAKKEFLILTKLDPTNFENYYELGVIYFKANVFDRASTFLKRSLASNPQHAMSYYYMGQIHYRTSNLSDAKNSFIESLKLEQSNYKAHYFLGLVLRQLGDYEWAIKEFDTAQKNEDIKVKCLLAKGTCYIEREQYPKAIIELERGLKFAKRGSDTELNLRYFLAESQEKLRDLHSAIFNWEKISEVNKNFRDVQEKLKMYNEFRQDDRIKDFMIAGLSKFEHICRKLVESLELTIMDIDIMSDTEIDILATETEGKWRNTRNTNRIIRIMRTTNTITDNLLRKIHETMRPRNATRIIIISTGEYSQTAIDFSNTRPLELIGKSDLVKLLKNIDA